MNTPSTRHTLALIPLSGTAILERIGFYGVRTLMIMYLTSSASSGFTDHSNAFKFLESFNIMTAIFPILGGVLADVLMGGRLAIMLGGLFSAIGCFILCIPNTVCFVIGMTLIAFGNGLHSTNILSQVALLYRRRFRWTDSAVAIVLTGTHIGAFIGPLIAIPFSKTDHAIFGFCLAGFFAIASSLCMLPFGKSMKEMPFKAHIAQGPFPRPKYTAIIVLAMVLSVFTMMVYWGFVNTEFNRVMMQLHRTNLQMSSAKFFELHNIANGLFIILGLLGLSILLSFVRISIFLRASIGIFLQLLCALLSSSIMDASFGDDSVRFLFVLYSIFSGLSEVLMLNSILSLFCKYVPAKFSGLMIGLYLGISRLGGILIQKITNLLPDEFQNLAPYILGTLLFVFAALFLLFFFLGRKEEQAEPEMPPTSPLIAS